jgi:FkbM family methyltransferase
MKYEQASPLHRLLIALYGLVNRLGLLRLPFLQYCFEASYFLFKSLAGDSWKHFLHAYGTKLGSGHFLDVGANIGYTVTLFRSVLENGCKIHAFEPESENFRALQRRFAGDNGVELHRLAVADSEQVVKLWRNPQHHADHRVQTAALEAHLSANGENAEYEQVEAVSLDGFCRARQLSGRDIAFIKIDVQGLEIPVLRGMQGIVAANPGLLIGLEFDKSALRQSGFEPVALLDLLEQMELDHWLVGKDGKPFPVYSENMLSERIATHVDLLCGRHLERIIA